MPGVETRCMPSFLNEFQFFTCTAVYTSGILVPYSSASLCVLGNSGQRYGIIMFQHAITTAFARTLCTRLALEYSTSTSLAEAGSPTCRARTTVLFNRI